MKHLLLFTITPVQSFIAQSRKVRDLAAGSAILSALITEAIDFLKITEKILDDDNLIFPNTELLNKPNRFLAYVNTKSPQKLGEGLEKHMHEFFIKQAKSELKKYYSENLDNALAQLKDLLKIYWVIIPATDDFLEDYEKIERLLGGVKNLRAFQQFAEKGRKCAINGEYNVTIYRHKENNRSPYWLTYTDNVETKSNIEHSLLSYGEGLSTINFYKRVYNLSNNSSFDATCQIAYLDATEELSGVKKIRDAIDYLINIDEQYLYDDTPIRKGDYKQGIKANRKIIKEELKNQGVKLPKYYATLMFDADKMGQWLSGYFLKDKSDLLAFQKKISQLFGKFAKYARSYVDGDTEDGIRKGQTIYAGGDDYLGLINLKYLFDVLKNLNTQFECLIWNELEKEFDFREGTEMITFSAGVAIAHYKTPLSFVLNEARKAEKIAKDKAERKAFSITVLKRSGEIHQSYFKWHDKNGNYLPDALAAIINALNDKSSSNKFITSFTRLFAPVITDSHTRLNSELIKSELRRLLKDNQVEDIQVSVFQLLDEFYSNKGRLSDFIYALNIADFIGREINSLHISNSTEICQ
jgi:CRISPR-associated protein Cmr2